MSSFKDFGGKNLQKVAPWGLWIYIPKIPFCECDKTREKGINIPGPSQNNLKNSCVPVQSFRSQVPHNCHHTPLDPR